MNGGIWTDSWVRTARVANQLAREVDLLSELSTLDALDGVEALSNPFYAEVSTLYDALALDGLDGGTDPSVLGGRFISLDSGTYHPALFRREGFLLLGATDSLSSKRDRARSRSRAIREYPSSCPQRRNLAVGPQASLRTVVADLVVSARQDALLQDTALETAREVALHSTPDLQLRHLITDSMVRIQAAGSLEVDGLQLSQSPPSLIMEATTIRLSNIDFLLNTSVQLNSLKGPIDGRYPNFGTSIPFSDQVGRVNFLQNVRSGECPDRSTQF